jgi:alpha-tubulin suppressor-like RCC1 family protein
MCGQLGIGNTTQQNGWVQITAITAGKLLVDVQTSGYIGSNVYSTVFLCSDGSLYVAGYNAQGQLGLGSTTQTPTATLLPFAAVAVGVVVTKVIKLCLSVYVIFSDGSYARWGYNANGQLSNSTFTNATFPVYSNYSDPGGRFCVDVFSGLATGNTSGAVPVFILKESGLYFSGNNDGGCGGLGNTLVNTNISNGQLVPVNSLDIQNMVQIGSMGATGGFLPCFIILTSDGKLYGSGSSSRYMLNTVDVNNRLCFKSLIY